MKVLIDIPKESYDFAKECKHNGTSKYNWGLTYNNTVFMIANGTPIPDNATNGDMLLELLAGQHDKIYPVGNTQMGITLDCEWWNAPYNGGSEND